LLACSNTLLDKVKAQTKKEKTYLELIHKSGITMQNLLDDLLDISRNESMGFPLSIHEVDIFDMIRENMQYNQQLAEAKGIQVNLLVPPGRLMARLDPVKIEQVLNNLFSNAIKYSPRYSTVTVSVEVKPDEIVISVQDQGPGIPLDEQYSLFKPFQTTSIQPPSGETSTGLGLYIARRIVEEHGGRIWVESDTGNGSMFCFSLKHAQAPSKDLKASKQYDSLRHM
jgi:signal transduction histidine kinase